MPKKWYVGVDAQRGLPSGYTQLSHIQSSGTQYINTGFTANQNTKMVLDCEITYGTGWIMIAGSYDSNARFSWWAKASQLYVYYVSANQNVEGTTGRFTLTADKNTWTAGANSMSFDASTFSATSPIYLCSVNGGGNYENAAMKIYSCKIYDNGTLVRDFVPCRNASNVVGLYDMVNGVFYANAGTGVFTEGSAVPAGGVAREVKKPYFGVSNVARKVKKGYVGIDNIARQFFQHGLRLGDMEIGSSVFLNVSGVSREFLVVNQGNPDDSFYDASCDGTWLMAKYAFDKQIYSSTRGSYYESSKLYTYQNNTFFAKLDAHVQACVKTVKIPHRNASGDVKGANGLTAKVFIPSFKELGATSCEGYTLCDTGRALDYFEGINAKVGSDYVTQWIYSTTSGAGQTWSIRDSHGIVYDSDFVYSYPACCWISSSGKGNPNDNGDGEAYARHTMVFYSDTMVNPDTFEILV